MDNPTTLKHGVTLAAGLAIGSLLLPHSVNVKYQLPEDSKMIYVDGCGTDGKDPTKMFVVFRIPQSNGTFREVRIRKDQAIMPPAPTEKDIPRSDEPTVIPGH